MEATDFSPWGFTVNGTSTNPVYFTSYKDDSLGGDTLGDGATTPAKDDYGMAIKNDGGTVDADYANINYASYGVQSTGSTSLNHSTIDHTGYALYTTSGNAKYRGSILNTDHGIYACNWTFSCSVNAVNVDWGRTTGPFNGSGDAEYVCGQAIVSPWKFGSSSYTTAPYDIFSIPACGSGSSPSQDLTNHINEYVAEADHIQTRCADNGDGVCEYYNTYNACIQAAWNLATSSDPFTLPSGSPISNPTGYYTSYLDAAGQYIESLDTASSTAFTFAAGSALIGTVSTVSNLSGAYSSCLTAAHNHGY